MNLTPDYVAWAGIGALLSAVVSIIATIAALRAADAARRATDLATIQQRETRVRAVYRDAHRVAVMATRVDQIAETMNIATQMMLNAAGQAGDTVGKIEAKRRQVLKRTEELSQYALKILDSDPKAHTDTGLSKIQRDLDGYLTELDAIKDRLSTELDFAKTGLSTPNALQLMAAHVRAMHRN